MKPAGFRRSRLPAAIFALTTSAAMAQELPSTPQPSDIEILSRTINWNGMVVSLVLILLVWMLLRFVDRLVTNFGTAFPERRLALQRLNAFFHFSTYLLAIGAVILLSLDLSPQVLAIMGGAVAVAVGFATKDLVASLVAGLLIMFDRPFQVGDRVRFGGEYGDVLAIGLRSVKLRTLDDSMVTIPNNLFLSDVAASANSGALDMQVVVDFHVGVDQDVQRAQALVTEAAATSPYVYLPKPIAVKVSQQPFGRGVALRLRLKAYVFDTQYEKDFESDVTLRAMDAFAESGIRPPPGSGVGPSHAGAVEQA